MPKFAANLSMLFTEYEFLDRFAAAAAAGFNAVEYLFPYAYEAEVLRAALAENHLRQVLFNLPPGDWEGGERGLAALPGREDEFRASVATALHYLQALDCPRAHVMAGIVPGDAESEVCRETYIENLRYAAGEFAKFDKLLLIEPLNLRDNPGYLLSRQETAVEICQQVGAANIKVQFDFYHCQIAQGDLTRTLDSVFPHIGHIQIAGVPDRHEPDTGEVNYPWLFEHLDSLGYDGWIGCEYRPRGETRSGLAWGQKWGLGCAD
ncbi:MAG: hydroxypyruvate isomerase family protein [Desulfuromonadales bacterium]|nr:hydroxypyruvate isomerase family protein [Desulfuromonadales bacterium]